MNKPFENGQVVQVREWDYLKLCLPNIGDFTPEKWHDISSKMRSIAGRIFAISPENTFIKEAEGNAVFCPLGFDEFGLNPDVVDELLTASEHEKIKSEAFGVECIEKMKLDNAIMKKTLKIAVQLMSKAYKTDSMEVAIDAIYRTKELSSKILRGVE